MDDSIPLAERISLYFDGSCQENRNVTAETRAGWGVVVVRGDSGLGKGDGEVIEELSGPVIVSPDEEGFLGAEVGRLLRLGCQRFLRGPARCGLHGHPALERR